jgi:hypothetical protein
MHTLMKQVNSKEMLYFFCISTIKENNKEKTKYIIIKRGVTIEEVYNKYGSN